MHRFSPLIFLPIALLFSGCSEGDSVSSLTIGNHQADLPKALVDGDVWAICVDSNNQLLDFVQVTPDSGIERVVFAAPDSGEEISVFVVGSNIDKRFALDEMVASSKNSEGYMVEVSVDFLDDIAVGLIGNGLGNVNNLEDEFSQAIEQARAKSDHHNLPSTQIVKLDRYKSQLIVDEDGNHRPAELSSAEAMFLKKVVDALQSGHLEQLTELTQTRDGDIENQGFIADGLTHFKPFTYLNYIFCRIDPEHPGNKDIFSDFEGNPYFNSLPPVYSLDLVLQVDNQAYPMNYGITVGISDDTLKIVVPYL